MIELWLSGIVFGVLVLDVVAALVDPDDVLFPSIGF